MARLWAQGVGAIPIVKEEPVVIRATLAASTRRVDDGAVAVGRAKVESFVVSMSHSDAGHAVARGGPLMQGGPC